MIYYNKIIYGAFAAFAIFATACTDSVNLEDINNNSPLQGEASVALSIDIQKQIPTTRAEEEVSLPYISDGKKVDVLYYAVYEDGGQDKYTLIDKQYSVKVNPSNWPLKLKFALDQNKNYRIAFWAQSSEAEKYYKTDDLTEIKVNYKDPQSHVNYLNNDELRDAFTSYCTVTKGAYNGNVVLHRPFAQINIGTTGYDYEGAAILKPDQVIYTESSITLDGVAQYYNAVTGKALVDEDKHPTTTAVFDFNTLPGFLSMTTENPVENVYTPQEGEQFLKVKIFKDNDVTAGNTKSDNEDFFSYISWNAFKNYRDAKQNFEGKYYEVTKTNGKITSIKEISEEEYKEMSDEDKYKLYDSSRLLAEGVNPATETFKYLSMCYVLVPEETDGKGSVLNSIKFQSKGKEITIATDGTITTGEKVISSLECAVLNVPVQRNWRTNLLGNNFYIQNFGFILDVVPQYCGDNNHLGEIADNTWYHPRNSKFDYSHGDDNYHDENGHKSQF